MSVEAPAKPRTIRQRPKHQEHRPEPVAVLDPRNQNPTIAAVLDRIRRHHKARQSGSYVFIDQALNVYVISEEQSVALCWVKERLHDLVGLYRLLARANEPWLQPTTEGLAEDFTGHLRVNGWSA